MIFQEIPPRSCRRSNTLQPLLLHPSASGQQERANITAPAHLLSQCLHRISWIFQAAKAASQMAPNTDSFRHITIFAGTSMQWHFSAAQPCVQLFRNGRIQILSTANYKNLTHLLVKFTNRLNGSGFLLVNDLCFCCSGKAVPNNMDL